MREKQVTINTQDSPLPDSLSLGFWFPPGATAPVAERVNQALLMAPTRQQLRPYCFVLDTFVRGTTPPAKETLRVSRAYATVATRWPGGQSGDPRLHWAGDVVVIGECSGSADLAFMARLLDGLARSGRTVLYLSTSRHESHSLRERASELDWRSRVTTISSLQRPYQEASENC
jgi:hypothetical protein